MELYQFENMEEKEILPGLFVRFVHSENMTLAYWRILPGCELPTHSHVNEQVVNVIEGELELVVDGRPHILTRGKVVVLPPDMPHSGKAITECHIIDVFHPVREDFR